MVASAPRNWATMRPSWMTPIRSARARISSRLEEISSTATPSSRASTRPCQTNWVAPMSRPRVGWAAISSLELLSNSRPRTSFCWLPPDRAEAGGGTLGALTREPRAQRDRPAPDGLQVEQAPPGERLALRLAQDRVLADQLLQDHAAGVAVLGDVGQA